MSDTHQPASRNPAGDSKTTPRQIALVKQDQRYIFRYAPGEEARVLDELACLARDPTCPFDWFDAAVLSHQMGQRLGHQLEDLLKP